MIRTLKSKITVFTTLLIAVAMSLILYIVYQVGTKMLIHNSIEHYKGKALLVANEIENAIIEIAQDISMLSQTPPIQGIVRSYENKGEDESTQSNLELWRERLATIFISMLKANPNYAQIRYIGISDNGQEIVRANRSRNELYITDKSALQKKGGRSYFEKAIQLSQGSVFFSSIDYNIENNRIEYPYVPTLRVITPIYSSKQKIFGALVINVNITRYLTRILSNTKTKDNVIIYDRLGGILVYNTSEHVVKYFNKRAKNKTVSYDGKNYNLNSFVADIKNDKNYYTFTLPIFSNKYHDNNPFNLLYPVQIKNFSNKGDFDFNTFLFYIALISILASVAVYFFTKYITRNLTRMTNSIQATYSKDKKEIYLPVHLHDEVGLLASAFKEKTNQLEKIALFDGLTGLPNRKNFINYLEEAIYRAKRSHLHLALGYIDLNGFKEINDTYGHQYGDELLTLFSRKIKSVIRESDFAARLGGDEFAVIAENFEDFDTVKKTFSRFAKELNCNYQVKDITINLIISIGISLYPDYAENIDDLIHSADELMYESKRDKKGNVFMPKPI